MHCRQCAWPAHWKYLPRRHRTARWPARFCVQCANCQRHLPRHSLRITGLASRLLRAHGAHRDIRAPARSPPLPAAAARGSLGWRSGHGFAVAQAPGKAFAAPVLCAGAAEIASVTGAAHSTSTGTGTGTRVRPGSGALHARASRSSEALMRLALTPALGSAGAALWAATSGQPRRPSGPAAPPPAAAAAARCSALQCPRSCTAWRRCDRACVRGGCMKCPVCVWSAWLH